LRERRYAWMLGSLTVLFALRVVGQALQRWAPQPFLPAFDEFQGSGVPYGLLLSIQIVLLLLMARVTRRIATGASRPSRRAARVLGWAGGVYMTGSLLRIVAGVVLPDAPAWFSTWVPAFFHVVLAGFVLTLALYHAGDASAVRT
jgi:hypothetical protein